MAGPADTLKVFSSVRIPRPQSPDKPCRHDVIHMASRSSLLKIHSTGFYFADSAKSRDSSTAPSFSIRSRTWPSSIHTFPTDWLFLRPKFRLTELTAAVAVRLASKTLRSEDFCLAIPTVGTAHDGP